MFQQFLLYLVADLLKGGASPRLLDWESVQCKLPWNVIILLGSGFAIAEAAEVRVHSAVITRNTNVFASICPLPMSGAWL